MDEFHSLEKPLKEILSLDLKHKEKVALIVEKSKRDQHFLAEVVELLRTGSDVEKGTAAEVFKFVSSDNPEMMFPYIDVLIEYIDYKAPRVRWGCPEAIGNLACRYPTDVERAIPKLLGNLEDESIVVRWCAAYALAEIAWYDKGRQAELVSLFRELAEKEANNGVKKVYFKAIKEFENTG